MVPPLLTTDPEDAVGLDLEFITGPQLFAIVTIFGLIVAIGVYWDARRRDIQNPGIWAATVGFLFLLYAIPGLAALVVYLVMRGQRSAEDRSA